VDAAKMMLFERQMANSSPKNVPKRDLNQKRNSRGKTSAKREVKQFQSTIPPVLAE
jgi:hypothetical protein